MSTDPLTRARRRFMLVALVIPSLLVLVAVVLQIAMLSAAPAVVASHWGVDGTPDGFSPAWTIPVLAVAVGGGIPVLIFATSIGALRRGGGGAASRAVGAVALGTAVLIAASTTAILARHAGVADPAMVTFPPALVLVIALAAIAGGFAGYLVQPASVPLAATAGSTPALDVRRGERVVWLKGVSLSRGGLTVLFAAWLVLAAVTAIVALTTGDAAATGICVGITVLLTVLLTANARYRVRVDHDGLLVRSVAGWPRVRVPLAEITGAEVVQVEPMAEFGGWGLRWGPDGRFGVVLRAGEGLLVRRRDGRSTTVTVDDAETGAALIGAYLALTDRPGRA